MEWLKPLHISCVVLSFSGFFFRGVLLLIDSAILQQKWLKIVPHIVDSVLLLSAILMLYELQLNPLENSWLLAKIVALLVYIALGFITLKYAKNKTLKAISWLSGLVVFLYIVSVALSKSAGGFLVY